MAAGNIGHLRSTAAGLQGSAAMVGAPMRPRRRPRPGENGSSASFQASVHSLARFKRRSRLVLRMMLLALMGCTLPCGAVTLGDATLLSGPAQPLRVEIELASELQPGLQVRLASEQVFRENGLSYPAWLGRAQVSLLPIQGLRRRTALLLTAPQAVQAPLVELMFEFSWPTGGAQQLYVLLLDASTRTKDGKALADAPVAFVAPAPQEDSAAITPSGAEPPADPARADAPRGMVFEMALRFPFKNREHAGLVSARSSPATATGPGQDRLRLAQAQSAQANRIARERREADQQARMQELERNTRQMRELAAEVAAAAPQAGASSVSPVSSPPPITSVAAIQAAGAPQTQRTHAVQRPSGWLWVLGFTAPLLLAVWSLRFWLSRRRRAEFSDSGGAARSVFELSPAEAGQAYADYRRQQAPARANTPGIEDARALFVVGRFAEARQWLDGMLRHNPRNHEAWFLLARVLGAQEDRAGLARCMPQLRELTGETGELWDRVRVLGHELDPGNPLYQPAGHQCPPQEHPAAPAVQQPAAVHRPPAPTTASSAVDDAMRMATAYGARPV